MSNTQTVYCALANLLFMFNSSINST